jgi:hypothetical protein
MAFLYLDCSQDRRHTTSHNRGSEGARPPNSGLRSWSRKPQFTSASIGLGAFGVRFFKAVDAAIRDPKRQRCDRLIVDFELVSAGASASHTPLAISIATNCPSVTESQWPDRIDQITSPSISVTGKIGCTATGSHSAQQSRVADDARTFFQSQQNPHAAHQSQANNRFTVGLRCWSMSGRTVQLR